MMGWQWHQLDHMQIICTSLQTDNHTSTLSLNFLQGNALLDAVKWVSVCLSVCLSTHCTKLCSWQKGNISLFCDDHFPDSTNFLVFPLICRNNVWEIFV